MDAIDKRKSVRKYKERFLNADEITKILHLLEMPFTGPGRNEIKFEFIAQDLDEDKGKVGTYGFVSGKYGAILGWCPKESYAYVDYGFTLENIALNLIDMDLGTCWLGGSFSRKNVIQAIGTDQRDSKTIPGILTVGYEAQGKRIRDVFISGTKRRRKELEECFFDSGLQPIEDEERKYILEGVRWAPSAMNRQPTRVIWDGNKVHFYLADAKIDLRYIDIGIAMCHFERRSRNEGLKGKWIIDSEAPKPNWLYVYTYLIE